MSHDLRRLVDHLDATGTTYTAERGELVLNSTVGLTPALVDRIRPWRDLLYAIADAPRSGHAAGWCDTCGEMMIIAGNHKGRKCVMSPLCEGRHRPDSGGAS